ncbi:6-phosphogluconate dehydrogenase C-terminal domain-like protein [Schizopora paradoxa]|uniref:6-phosphogluconate dehydrogenase C-terminal domain-like protein n=1 Tax=Schizopora paradoxa TaxID=27342 RepID=A0A0H2RAY4_9AGAM|nr:6-phosphogluconate dehydrogenase C-terminal domain-like protein [Schizopora paradoxa]
MVNAVETPIVAIISAGTMGAGLARRLTSSNEGHAPCTVLTVLKGRSQGTRERARNAGMQDVASLSELVHGFPRCKWILSIVPPSEAERLLIEFIDAVRADAEAGERKGDHLQHTRKTRAYPYPTFVDCNAKNPNTARRFAQLVRNVPVPLTFIDGSIVGLPPRDDHNPSIYASASPDPAHQEALFEFQALTGFGLQVKAMTGDDVNVGDASALKMTFSGIMKGMVGLYSTMILAAHAHSPATAKALIEELHDSQPMHLRNVAFYVPNAFSKAYRFVHEMTEMADFLKDALDADDDHSAREGKISAMFDGFGSIFERVATSEAGDHHDVEVLARYASYADNLFKSS